ncbi:MAG: hypothetical protein ACRET0_16075 [Steroidobacteraceae bacterium]
MQRIQDDAMARQRVKGATVQTPLLLLTSGAEPTKSQLNLCIVDISIRC